jgi:hypothetical protein
MDSTEMYDGCPLVTLYDDALDMTHFLKALHDSTQVYHIYPINLNG